MKAKHVALLSLLAAAALTISLAPAVAPAQQPAQKPGGGAMTIATANPSKVFMGMKEKTEVQAKLKQELAGLEQQNESRKAKVAELKSALELLKPDAPQFEEANKAYMEAAIAHKNWFELSQAQASRNEKLQTKFLFDKINATIAELAKERGIDLVIAEQPPFAVDRMTTDQLTQAMAQRQILYSSASVDLTNDVIAKLDEKFNATKK